ncbi:FHA domain-containing protein [Flammeovirga sp. SubArs3]|uniref:FHA domain-containing protein n=1 Tax=Flammeovirga sp. SubArs3 TaxID=2995316 RepID=UPI00248A996F|nr:FHA domain-containing protein [Flammeovirga sp. SubArs3]
MKKISLGRAPDNTLILSNSKISSKHCEIHDDGNDYLIYDCNSTNGTYINGHLVRTSIIEKTDRLVLADYEIDLQKVLRAFDYLKEGDKIPYPELSNHIAEKESNASIKDKFLELENVYDDYIAKKKKIMLVDATKKTGIRAGLAFIPVVGPALGILSSNVGGNVQQKIMDLDEEHKKNYVCPKCYKFFGNEPFENLKKRGFCFACKTKWLEQ